MNRMETPADLVGNVLTESTETKIENADKDQFKLQYKSIKIK